VRCKEEKESQAYQRRKVNEKEGRTECRSQKREQEAADRKRDGGVREEVNGGLLDDGWRESSAAHYPNSIHAR
jgi:hypothetical protein